MTPTPFDFQTPPPGALEHNAGDWLAAACRRAAGPWTAILPYQATLTPNPVNTVPTVVALAAVPTGAVGIPVTTPDPDDGTALLAIARPLLLALLSGLLGEIPAELPEDREPSDLELSLYGYLIRELFLAPLEAGWPGADGPRLVSGAPAAPRIVLGGLDGDMNVAASVTVSAPFGDHPVHLVFPRRGRWERLARPETTGSVQVRPDPERMAALVREMPVDLSVVLGEADLTMADLAQVRTGDVLVLRRKVSEPLDGLVAGERKFRVWPGAVGTRVAVQVHTVTD